MRQITLKDVALKRVYSYGKGKGRALTLREILPNQ
jgi:hypothetical protein